MSVYQSIAAAMLGTALSPVFAQNPEPPSAPSGQVIFSRGADTAAPAKPASAEIPTIGTDDPLAVSDTERSALTFSKYDLDVHLTPESSSISVRAALTVRNDSSVPLSRAILQLSSTLHWDAVSLDGKALTVSSRLVETDADHTGAMDEAVIKLPQALAPGASVNLTVLYSGTVGVSTRRLERTGAPAAEARASDWDTIGQDGTLLRGFGYVLWYPVSTTPVFFRDGDRLFNAIGAMRLRESSSTVRLRLAVEYKGEPPDAAFFAGRREILKAISDNADAPAAEAPGIATATFVSERLGFRAPDLFITSHAPVQFGTAADPELLSAVTSKESAVSAYSAAAGDLEPLLTEWYGPHAQSPLYVIDHPGQPFEDDTLLIRPLASEDPAALRSALAHCLTHAWIHSAHPWIDEGLAEFSRVLWLERTRGHEAAIAALQESYRNLAAAESPLSDAAPAQSSSSSSSTEASAAVRPGLSEATNELFYRTKAAAVWWMLRSIVGDQVLQHALQAYRSDTHADGDPQGLQHTLEKFSHTDLRWFFDDWVYQDRGLPRLSIASVAPSELKGRTGIPDGWLVAVEVRNEGDASAEVPVTVRSSGSAQTERLRIPGHSASSTRIVFAGTPDQVIVNDGGVPEAGVTTHTRQLTLVKP